MKTSAIQGTSRIEEILFISEFDIEKFGHILYIKFGTDQPARNR